MRVRIIKDEILKFRISRKLKREVRRVALENGQDLSGYLRNLLLKDLKRKGVNLPEEVVVD